jgi:hypothetical protein
MATKKRRHPRALSPALQASIVAAIAGAALIVMLVVPIITRSHG